MCNATIILIDFSNWENNIVSLLFSTLLKTLFLLSRVWLEKSYIFVRMWQLKCPFQKGFCIFSRFSVWLIFRREHAGIGNSLADKNNRWITCFYCPWFYSKSSWNVLELSLNFFSRYPHQPSYEIFTLQMPPIDGFICFSEKHI